MSNKFLSFNGLCKKVFKSRHRCHFWFKSLVTLFHSRHNDLFQTFRFHYLTFRVSTIKQRNMVNSYFCSFLRKPFHAVHILGWSHCQVNVSLPQFVVVPRLINCKLAMFVRGQRDVGIVKPSHSIGQGQRIALFHS